MYESRDTKISMSVHANKSFSILINSMNAIFPNMPFCIEMGTINGHLLKKLVYTYIPTFEMCLI